MMMFYNGFNLMIDTIVAVIVGYLMYKVGKSAGYAEHELLYMDSIDDREVMAADYFYEVTREEEL